MTIRHSVVAAIALLSLAACSSSSGAASLKDAGPAVTHGPARPAPTAAAPAAAKPRPAQLSKQDRASYLAALNTVDPKLTSSPSGADQAIRHAENVCQKIHAGVKGSALTQYTTKELSGSAVTLNAAKAARILPMIRKYICPTA